MVKHSNKSHRRRHSRTHSRTHSKQKKHTLKHRNKKNRRNKTRVMRGGKQPLTPQELSNAPQFVPKGVPFVPPGGGAKTGIANGHYYYNKSPDFHGQNNAIMMSGPAQSGGGIQAIMPDALLNLGWGISNQLHSLYNGFVGQPNWISNNPNPLKQPIGEYNGKLNVTPPNLNEITKQAQVKAANF
jgi:hypothetical protein